MTLQATREGRNITIHGNTGVEVLVQRSMLSYVKITEDFKHIKYFHTQLGILLSKAEAEANAAAMQPEPEPESGWESDS